MDSKAYIMGSKSCFCKLITAEILLLLLFFHLPNSSGGHLPPSRPKELVSNDVQSGTRYWTPQSHRYLKHVVDFSLKDKQLGCKELRSKKYVSDGHCTSMKPILEVVCSGLCMPVADLPWYSELLEQKSYRDIASQWRCVNGKTVKEKVNLLCQDGTERSYKIRLVKSCKCKRNHSRSHFSQTL